MSLCKLRRTGVTLQGLSRSFSQLRRKAFPLLSCSLPLDGLKALQNTFPQKKMPLQKTRFKKVDSYHRATIEFRIEI